MARHPQKLWILGLFLLSQHPAWTAALPSGKALPFTEESLFSTPGRSSVPRIDAEPRPAAADSDELPQDIITREDLLVVIPTSLSRRAYVCCSASQAEAGC